MPTLKEQLTQDMKDALRAHESQRLSVIRFLISEIKNAEIDGASSDDASLQKIIATQVKKTKDALSDFQKAGRSDLVEQETTKVKLMEAYLPQQLTDHALEKIITDTLANQPKPTPNLGPLIGQVMKKVAGQADSARVKAMIEKLTS